MIAPMRSTKRLCIAHVDKSSSTFLRSSSTSSLFAGHFSSASIIMPMTSTLATSRKRLQRLVRSYRLLVILVVAGTLLHFGRTPNLYRGSYLPQYEPGRLGNFLVGRHEDHKKPEVASPWHAELFRQQASESLFTWNDRDDRCDNLNTPEGFELEVNEEKACWRLRLLRQLNAWKPHKSFR
jgi:hypothetical protein